MIHDLRCLNNRHKTSESIYSNFNVWANTLDIISMLTVNAEHQLESDYNANIQHNLNKYKRGT